MILLLHTGSRCNGSKCKTSLNSGGQNETCHHASTNVFKAVMATASVSYCHMCDGSQSGNISWNIHQVIRTAIASFPDVLALISTDAGTLRHLFFSWYDPHWWMCSCNTDLLMAAPGGTLW
jgi:hypothetical protein